MNTFFLFSSLNTLPTRHLARRLTISHFSFPFGPKPERTLGPRLALASLVERDRSEPNVASRDRASGILKRSSLLVLAPLSLSLLESFCDCSYSVFGSYAEYTAVPAAKVRPPARATTKTSPFGRTLSLETRARKRKRTTRRKISIYARLEREKKKNSARALCW